MTHEESKILDDALEFASGDYKPGSTLDVKYAKPMVAGLLAMLDLRGTMGEPRDESDSTIPDPQPE